MRATLLNGIRDISLDQVADPSIQHPTDAVVTVSAACICGSDLHPYRGHVPASFPKRAGHEFVGRIAAVGSEVSRVAVGDFVIAPFAISELPLEAVAEGYAAMDERRAIKVLLRP